MDLMLDLETMGRRPDAAITQIGAAFFDPMNGKIFDRIRLNVSLRSSFQNGGTISPETVEFWLRRPESEYPTWLDTIPFTLGAALQDFADFSRRYPGSLVWSHVSFDVPILASAYRAFGEELPFMYQDCRDLRTLIGLADYKRPDHNGRPHDALSDCEYQIAYLVEAMKKLRGTSDEARIFEDSKCALCGDKPAVAQLGADYLCRHHTNMYTYHRQEFDRRMSTRTSEVK